MACQYCRDSWTETLLTISVPLLLGAVRALQEWQRTRELAPELPHVPPSPGVRRPDPAAEPIPAGGPGSVGGVGRVEVGRPIQ